MKTKFFVCSFYILLFLFSFISLRANAASDLRLSVITDKPIYSLQFSQPSTIGIAGNLTLNGTPISDGLVALTVFQGTLGHYVRPIIYRTLTTGTMPPQNWNLSISLDVLAYVDSQYVPQTVFTRPSSQNDLGPAFNITCRTSTNWLYTLYLALTIVDAAGVPVTAFKVTELDQAIPPNSTIIVIVPPYPLEDWVALGNATVYVSAYENFPPSFYYPYCPEASSQFTIVSGGGQASSQVSMNTSPTQTLASVNGNYNLTFNLNYYQARPLYFPWGNYTVEVFSFYQGRSAVYSYAFWVKIPGDNNGDGIVNSRDFAPIAAYWLQTVPPAPAYADIDGDGFINSHDYGPIAAYWLSREQPLP